jgi:hypothetical protein
MLVFADRTHGLAKTMRSRCMSSGTSKLVSWTEETAAAVSWNDMWCFGEAVALELRLIAPAILA